MDSERDSKHLLTFHCYSSERNSVAIEEYCDEVPKICSNFEACHQGEENIGTMKTNPLD